MGKMNDSCEINCLHEEVVSEVSKDMINDKTAMLLAETFKAMGDITRIKIINVLSWAELCVCDIAFLLGMSQSAISHQLRVLRSLKLVKNRKAGKVVYYSLDDQHIVNLFAQGLEHVLESNRL
ncbi:MAG: metalloregulator ArsR/SmtB family transcription factor [Clostridia bacterium]|nr:metalloregulator ArsR/SmtB family transcription factor [Clostridia bacterium]